ncbi:hypothetical protein K3495_g7925 [Podosphaera aphanis]|nr:hypothetical protein K3495_g7925 [Podosphaera aphanis]
MALSKTTRIFLMLAVDTAFLVLELGVGVVVGSLALMADAFHMLNDIISLSVGLWAVVVAKKTSSDKYSFGARVPLLLDFECTVSNLYQYFRAEILGAFFNAVFLIALCLTITLEATQRLIDPPEVKNPELILIIGCLGLASNILGFFILGGHGHSHAPNHDHSSHEHDEQTNFLAYNSSEEIEGSHNHYHQDEQHGLMDQHISPSVEVPSRNKPRPGPNLPFITSEESCTETSVVSDKRMSKRISNKISGQFSQGGYGIHPASFRQSIIAACKPKINELCNDDSSLSIDMPEEASDGPEVFSRESSPLISKPHSHRNKNNAGIIKERPESHHGHNHVKLKKSKKGLHSHDDMGMNAMILHVIGDALGNVGVIISALAIWLTEWPERFYADPAVSLFITLIIIRSAIPLTMATAKILLQATPDHIQVNQIRDDIQALVGVVSCHHIHIWQLSDTQIVASLHLQLELSTSEATGEKYMEIARAVRKCLHIHGIHSATIQPEFCSDKDHAHFSGDNSVHVLQDFTGRSRCGLSDQCLLECVDGCYGKTCCTQQD